MKNICFFITSLEAGGTEKYLLRFLSFYKNEINTTIICKSGKLGELESEFRSLGADLVPLKMGYFNIFSWLRTLSILRKGKFDSVVDLTSNFGGIYLMIAKIARIRKRVSFYRHSSNHFKESSTKLIYNKLVKNLVFKYATNILSNSVFAFEFFYPKVYQNDSRFEVVFNGIDVEKFLDVGESKNEIRNKLNIPPQKFIIGHVGRVNSAKNHKTMLKVAEILTSKYRNIEFLFCGKETDNKNFIKLIDDKDLTEKTHLLGYRSDVPRVLKTIDYFIFPSITEGQPNSLIEAMLFSLPFCASNIVPIKECTPDFIHDQLINPLNTDDIIENIETYYNKPTDVLFKNAGIWAKKRYASDKQFLRFFEKL